MLTDYLNFQAIEGGSPMTQTPSRDWQKDMEMFEEANKAALTWLVGKGAAEAGVYWLKEAKVYKQSYEAVLRYAGIVEAREQRLKEAYMIMLKYIPRHVQECFGFDTFLATLYPDTPAPKEGDHGV